MGSKKKSETTSSNTTTAAPPSWTMPGIQDASAAVTNAIGETQALPKYTGGFVAQPNQGLLDATKNAYQGAATGAQELSGYVQQQMQMDPTAAINATIKPVFQQLQEQVLPGLQSSAMASGAYSGNRANTVLPAMAISDATDKAQDLASQFAYNRLQMLPDLADTVARLQTGGGDILSQIMGLDTAQQQAGINNGLASQEYDMQYPFRGLDTASALLGRLSGNYGTTTSNGTQTNIQSSSGLGNVVQGIGGLAGLAGSFAMPGGGTLGGNLLGSLFKKAA